MATSTIPKSPTYVAVTGGISGAYFTANQARDIETDYTMPNSNFICMPVLGGRGMLTNAWIGSSGKLNVTIVSLYSAEWTLPNWAHIRVVTF